MATWLLICGSPRANGVSAKIADALERQVARQHPDVSLKRFNVAKHLGTKGLRGCVGCDFCKENEGCVFNDCMGRLIDCLLAAERVLVVTPTYFAGVPSQFKAVLDRLQPLYWRRWKIKEAGEPLPEKRPFGLYIVGEGGDPHGYEPLVKSVRSALALADLRLYGEPYLCIGATNAELADVALPEGW